MNDKLRLGECKRGLSSLTRPHFAEGLLLQDDDLTAGVTYTRALSRLMFRTLFGCGVLCGLKVGVSTADCKVKVEIAAGLALTCLGDPIELQKPDTIAIDECLLTNQNELWIGLRKIEKCCAPRTAACSPDEDQPPSVCTRERDGYELCVFAKRPACSCGCAKLEPPPNVPANPPAAAGVPAPPPNPAVGAAPPPAPPAGPPAAPPAAAVGPRDEARPSDNTPCLCNQRTAANACYEKFYQGDCACECCDCEWVLLAHAVRDANDWKVDHSVRRFVRPVLMRDPLVA